MKTPQDTPNSTPFDGLFEMFVTNGKSLESRGFMPLFWDADQERGFTETEDSFDLLFEIDEKLKGDLEILVFDDVVSVRIVDIWGDPIFKAHKYLPFSVTSNAEEDYEATIGEGFLIVSVPKPEEPDSWCPQDDNDE